MKPFIFHSVGEYVTWCGGMLLVWMLGIVLAVLVYCGGDVLRMLI